MQGLPSLTRLHLSYSRALTDTGLASLRKLTNLRTLSLVQCPELTNRTLEHLGRLPLEHLHLCKNAQITDKGIHNLQFLTRWGAQTAVVGDCGCDDLVCSTVLALPEVGDRRFKAWHSMTVREE